MKLEPGEKTILGYFPTAEDADRAAGELKEAGVETVQVDRISRYGANVDAHYNNPVNRAVTVTGPTLYSDSTGENLSDAERVLLGADPSVSGYGNTDYGVAGGKAFMLTAVTGENQAEQVEDIIKANGGTV